MPKPRTVNVEPLLFFHSFSFGLVSTIGTAFVTFKYCLWLLDSSSVETTPNRHDYCLQLGTKVPSSSSLSNSTIDTDYLNRVQAAAARYMIIQEAVATVPTIVATIYIGAWSDKHGRKWPIIVSLAGSAIAAQISLVTAAIDSIPVYVLLGHVLITGLTGSMLVVYSGTYAMISDTVHEPKRLIIRIALAIGVSSIGSLSAQLVSAFVLQHWDDYALIFLCNSVCTFCAFLYGVCGLQETILFSRQRILIVSQSSECVADPAEVTGPKMDDEVENSDGTSNDDCDRSGTNDHNSDRSRINNDRTSNDDCDRSRINDQANDRSRFACLNGRFVKECITVLTKSRPGRRRLYLLTTVFSFTILFTTEPHSVLNLFAKRPPLSLTNSEYSFVTATGSAMIFAPVLTTWLLKTSDILLIVTGLAFGVFKMAMTAFSTQKWMLFLAMGVGGLSNLYHTGYRSFTTRLVEPDETGRLFAAVGAILHCSPLLGSVISNNLYAATLTWFPGFVFLFGACFSLLILFAMGYIYIDNRRRGGGVRPGQPALNGINEDCNPIIENEVN